MLAGIQSQLGYKLSEHGLKAVGKAYKANPGKGSFERCVKAVTLSGGAVDPKAVCAAQAMRTPAGKRELLRAAAKGRKTHKGTRDNWPWSKTTYSAATGVRRKVSKDKKEEARLRRQESAEAARIRKAEIAEGKRERADAARERARDVAEARKQKAFEAAEARKDRLAAARERKLKTKRGRAAKKSSSSYPALFGTPYAKLSPSQQALVRRATSNPGKKRKRNPEGAAAERYEYFHGRPPESVTEVTRTIHEHTVLSGIGKLKELTIASIDGKGQVVIKGFKGALLAQNERGTQLYIEGGDQTVDLAAFGIHDPHEREVLGAATSVLYDTTKDHLGADGGTASYHHPFGGKKNGKPSRLPIIVYDVRNKQLEFAGGGYTLPEVGIDG